MMKVALWDIAAAQRSRLAAALGADAEFVEAAKSEKLNVDVLIASRFAADDASRAAFRLLQVPGAGLDKIALDAIDPGAWVCNAFEHEAPISEYVLATLLEHEIQLAALVRQIPTVGWAKAYFGRRPHGELLGKTLTLIGFGHIGEAIAKRASAFGMRVLAVASKARATAPAQVERIGGAEFLIDALAAADYVVVACPLLPSTRGLLGAPQLKAMKPSAYLVNVARAEVVDENALYEALTSGAIAGAALDTWYAYPSNAEDLSAPSRHPFASLANVRMTPHASAWTEGVWERRCRVFAENARRLAAGRPLLNVVRAPLS